MLDSDFIGLVFVSSASFVFILCFSGAVELSSASDLLCPLDVVAGGSLEIIDRLTACFIAPLATFCFNEFCCDGDNVLS
jgi:hypothetical protein